MKKNTLLKLLLVLLLICTSAFCFTACGKDDNADNNNSGNQTGVQTPSDSDSTPAPEHQHVFDKQVVTENYLVSTATCEEKAVYNFSCSCGEKGTETFEHGEVLGHAYGDFVSNGDGTHTQTCANDSQHKVTEDCVGGNATCLELAKCSVCEEEYGNFAGHNFELRNTFEVDQHTIVINVCSVCDKVEAYENGVIHPHNYVDMGTVEATCTTTGISAWFKCQDCDKEIKVITGELGHDLANAYYQLDEHYHYRICKRANCQAEIKSKHQCSNWTIISTPPCAQENSLKGKCSLCRADVYKKAEHEFEFVEYVEGKAPTCLEDGEGIYKCKFCGETENRVESSLGHDFGELHLSNNLQEPCEHIRECSRCDATETEIIHDFGEWTLTNNPDNACEHQSVCGRCEETKYSTIHDWDEWQLTNNPENLCEFERICKRCDKPENKTEHAWGEWENIVPPTCVDSGIELRECNRCEKTEQRTVAPLGHEYEVVSEKLATCLESGWSYQVCKNCGKERLLYYKALGHEMVERYNDTYHWSQCVRGDVSTALEEHDLESVAENVTIDDGQQVIYKHTLYSVCEDCEYKLKVGESALHIHYETEIIEATFPTCTENGVSAGLKCAVEGCNDVLVEPIEQSALGHDWVKGNCTRCGETQLEMQLSNDGKYYTVKGKGSFTGEELEIPAVYKGIKVTHIGDSAFRGCTALTTITIGNNVTNIGANAFTNCKSLTSLVIPNSVTSIGRFAFCNCISLTKVNYLGTIDQWAQIGFGDFEANPIYYAKNLYINNELVIEVVLTTATKISAFSFYDCDSLISVSIGDSVTSIGNNAFSGCDSLISIVIPDSVTSIGSGVFSYCTSLTSIVIPDSVTSIGSSAFSNCISLISIEIPDSVTSIDNSVFYNCISLISIEISDSVTSIGNSAFYNCTSLTSIEIPDSVTSIDNSAFYNCNSALYTMENDLKYVKVNGNPYYLLMEATNKNSSSYTINPNTIHIATSVFSSCSSLSYIEIPDSVTSIGSYAFSYCTSLTSVEIGNSVTSIGDYAFGNCTALTQINFNATNCADLSYRNYVFYNAGKDGSGITVTFGDNATKIPAYLFYPYDSSDYSPKITSVTIGENITSIGSAAFYNCTSLTSVVIPDSVTSIGSSAFYNCTSLTNITIPDSVTSIDSMAFYDCTSLTAVNYLGTIDQWVEIEFASDSSNPLHYAKELRINGEIVSGVKITSVSKISDFAFYNCDSLTSIEIPDSVTSIGERAFSNCDSLTSIEIPDSVTSLGDGAFSNCTSLTSVTIGSGVTSIGRWVFSGCPIERAIIPAIACSSINNSSLKELIITTGKIIVGYTFHEHSSLTSVVIGDSVTSIGEWAFFRCTSLKNVIIGNGVINIGSLAFSGCPIESAVIPAIACPEVNNPNLKTVIITSGESIGEEAFSGCDSLTSIEIPNSVTSIGEEAFYNCDSLTSIEIPDSVTSIGERAFSGCDALTSIEIPDSVTSIGEYAFHGCDSLTSITIPNRVTSIGGGAFGNCYSLTEINFNATNCADLDSNNAVFANAGKNGSGINVTFGDNVTKIPAYLFPQIGDGTSGRLNIASITIGSRVSSIGSSAFSGCVGLTNIEIPDSVTSIGEHALYFCTSLTSVTMGSGVTSIGNSAFYGCYRLVEVYNKSNLDIIAGSGGYGGVGYYALNIYNEEEGSKLTTDGDGYVIYTDGANKILVSYIGEETDLIFPNDITAINKYAFNNYGSLTSVEIPDSVTSVGDDAFYGCTSLTSVTIGSGVTSIGSSAFSWCTSLTSINIPNSVTSIGKSAFYNCTSLTSVTIGSSVTSIGDSAFRGCTSLTSVAIGENVTSIGNYAFSNCTALTEINFNATNCSDFSYDSSVFNEAGQSGSGIKVTFGDNVIRIPEYLFATRYSGSTVPKITSVIIGNGVTSIGSSAFSGCSSLQYNVKNGLKYLGNPTNKHLYLVGVVSTDITTVSIDEDCKIIGYSALSDCTSLTQINFNAINCLDLDSNNAVFANAGKNGSGIAVIFGDNVTRIPAYLFYSSTHTSKLPKIISVTIGNGVTSIGDYVFFSSTSLQYNVKNGLKYLGNSSNKYLYLIGVVSTTLTTTTVDGNCKFIGSGAFSDCNSLTSVVIPDSVTSIGSAAFYKCTSLTSIIVDENNTNYKSIDGNLYSKDGTSLVQYAIGKTAAEFTIPEEITNIGDRAFRYCTSLTSVTIGRGVTNIGSYAFDDCTSLTSVVIPDSVTSIGSAAFRYCTSLTEINFSGTTTEWNNITKGSNWDNNIPATEVVCSDGRVTIGE